MAVTVTNLIQAFFYTLDVTPQDPTKPIETENTNRWRIVHVLSLLCLHMKLSSVILVSAQQPLQKRFHMNVFSYNTLLGVRCIPGLLATLIGPYLQNRFGSSHSIVGLASIYVTGTVLQATAIFNGSYTLELVAVLLIEGATGGVVAITSATVARVVQGEEQSRAVSICSMYTLLGMATPMIIIPWVLEHVQLSVACGFGTLFGGACGILAAFAYHIVVQGGDITDLDEPESNDAEVHQSLFSSSTLMRLPRQGLGIICVMSIVNGVALTLGENITQLLKVDFKLKQTEVAFTIFIGLISCWAGQLFGMVHDSQGYRPVATVVAVVCIGASMILASSHQDPITAVVLWSIGFSFNMNTGYSSLPIVTPPDMIPTMMALAAAGQYLGFIIIPIIYGFCGQYFGRFGFISLPLMLAGAAYIFGLVCTLNIRKYKSSLFGIRKYGEGDNFGEAADVPLNLASPRQKGTSLRIGVGTESAGLPEG